MSTVAVLGLGLMGGSMVRDLSALGRPVRAWSPDAGEVDAAGGLPGVIGCGSPAEAVESAAVVVLAAPLAGIRTLLETVRFPAEAWVQDLGSLQGPPLAWAAAAGISAFVSAHPMAGAEASGWAASREGLYRDAPVFLSHGDALSHGLPDGDTPGSIRAAAEAFWQDVGAVAIWRDPEEHDRTMAWVSHLPQVVATHLADLLRSHGLRHGQLGPGGRDTTRLAGSGPEMWADILGTSPATLGSALRDLARRLDEEADRLDRREAGAFAQVLAATRGWRRGGEGDG